MLGFMDGAWEQINRTGRDGDPRVMERPLDQDDTAGLDVRGDSAGLKDQGRGETGECEDQGGARGKKEPVGVDRLTS